MSVVKPSLYNSTSMNKIDAVLEYQLQRLIDHVRNQLITASANCRQW